MKWGKGLLRSLGIIAILSFLPGCMTAAFWRDASDKTIYAPQVLGSLEATEGQPPTLVLKYITWVTLLDVDEFALLTLDDAPGRSSPLLYTGQFRSADAIFDDLLSRNEFTRIAATQLPRVSRGEPPTSRLTFQAITSHPIGAEKEFEKPPHKLRIAAFRKDAKGFLTPVVGDMPDGQAGDIIWPADAMIVLIPYTQVRDAESVRRTKSQVALLTPLLLLADVVVTPVGLICSGIIYAAGGK